MKKQKINIYISHHHGEFSTKGDLSQIILKDFFLLWKHSFQLTPNIFISEQIKKEERNTFINKADAFIIILTPTYQKDKNCQDELNEILSATNNDFNRIFKIRKTEMHEEDEPALIVNLMGYDFFGLDYELQIFFNYTQGHDAYWERLDDLVEDLGNYFQLNAHIKNKRKVYLATTTPDRVSDYQELARDLKNHGFEVLPKLKPPRKKNQLEKFVFHHLEMCEFSIHILGELFGETLEKGEESVISYQLELARQFNESTPFRRFVLLPTKTSISERKQNKIIETLHFQERAQENAEITQTDIESFKDVIYQNIKEETKEENP